MVGNHMNLACLHRMRLSARALAVLGAYALITSSNAFASTGEKSNSIGNAELAAKLELLEAQNRLLQEKIGQLEQHVARVEERSAPNQPPPPTVQSVQQQQEDKRAMTEGNSRTGDSPATVI